MSTQARPLDHLPAYAALREHAAELRGATFRSLFGEDPAHRRYVEPQLLANAAARSMETYGSS